MKYKWKPKGWLAITLGLVTQPFVFLYVNKINLFIFYLILTIAVGILDLKLHSIPEISKWLEGINLSWLIILICPVHAFIVVRNYDNSLKRSWYANWWVTTLCFMSMFFSVALVRVFYFEPFKMSAASMSPTINSEDQLIVSKNGFGNYRYLGLEIAETVPSVKPTHGDIIVFRHPTKKADWVKRVIGLPGDTILYKNKTIYLKKTCVNNSNSCPDFSLIEKKEKNNLMVNQGTNVIYEESIDNITYNILINSKRIDSVSHYFKQANRKVGEWVVPDGQYFVMGDSRDDSFDSRYLGFIPQSNIIGKVVYIW